MTKIESESRYKAFLAKLARFARIWLVWRLPGLAFWYWLIAVQGRSTTLPALRHCWALALFPFVGHLLSKYRRLIIAFPVYLPVYYFAIFPVSMVVSCMSLLRTVGKLLGRVLRRFTRWTDSTVFVATTLVICAFLVAWLAITDERQILWALSWVTLALGGFLVVLLCMKWIMDPFALPRRVIQIALWSARTQGWIRYNYQFSEGVTRKQLNRVGEWIHTALLDETTETGVSKKLGFACVPISLLALAVLFIGLSLFFGCSYYGIWAARDAFVANPPISAPSLPISLYYSLTVAVTAPSNLLVPSQWPAFALQGLQHALSVFIVALIPAALFFGLSARHSEHLRELRSDIEGTLEFLRELWSKSKGREAHAKERSEKRVKPESLSEAIYRLVSVLSEPSKASRKREENSDSSDQNEA